MVPVAIASDVHRLAEGEVLFRQGDAATGIFQLESGVVRLERSTYDGRRIILHTALTGQFFAEASLFSEKYHCNAVAAESSLVRCYPKAAILRMVEEDPRSAKWLIALMARELQVLRHRLELRAVRSARDRLLLLLELQAGDDGTIRLSRQVQDLAFELGLSREVVYRTLSTLEKEGVIVRSPRSIRLLKWPLA